MEKSKCKNMNPQQFLEWLDSSITNKGEINGRVVNIAKLMQFKKACTLLKEIVPEKVKVYPPCHKERHAMAIADVDNLDIWSEKDKALFLELWKSFDSIYVLSVKQGKVRIVLTVKDVWSE